MAPPQRLSSSDAAVSADAFLAVVGKKQGPLKGECETPGHVDDISVIAWRWAVSSPTAPGSTQATGRRVYEHLEVDKYVDACSTRLLNALANNEDLKSVTLSLRKAGTDDEDFFVMTLEKARVTGSQIRSSLSGGLFETVSIAYQKITIDYHPQASSGQRGAASSYNDELDNPGMFGLEV